MQGGTIPPTQLQADDPTPTTSFFRVLLIAAGEGPSSEEKLEGTLIKGLLPPFAEQKSAS